MKGSFGMFFWKVVNWIGYGLIRLAVRLDPETVNDTKYREIASWR